MKQAGLLAIATWMAVAVFAPWLSPYDPDRVQTGRAYAPPTPLRMVDNGRLTRPYFHPTRLVSALERRFEEDRTRRIELRFFIDHRLFGAADSSEPFFLLGADALGRDVFSRVVTGARVSLTLSLVAAALATLIGLCVGLVAGYAGGGVDAVLSRVTELVLVLPALYVVVAFRALLPVVLTTGVVFVLLAAIFALAAWPAAARGVRAITASERTQGYVEAARAAGARRRRVLVRHLLPASAGYLWIEFALLVPSCLLFEGALSFAGLGFPDHVATWGTLLRQAANVGALGSAPWLLSPAVAIVTVVLAMNLIVDSRRLPSRAQAQEQALPLAR
jgi:peptide/nickel transport system permease protein